MTHQSDSNEMAQCTVSWNGVENITNTNQVQLFLSEPQICCEDIVCRCIQNQTLADLYFRALIGMIKVSLLLISPGLGLPKRLKGHLFKCIFMPTKELRVAC